MTLDIMGFEEKRSGRHFPPLCGPVDIWRIGNISKSLDPYFLSLRLVAALPQTLGGTLGSKLTRSLIGLLVPANWILGPLEADFLGGVRFLNGVEDEAARLGIRLDVCGERGRKLSE